MVAKYCKMWKIKPSEVCNFLYTFISCAEKCNHVSKCDYTPRIIATKVHKNLQTSLGFIFHILQCFATKLHHFTKFRILFSAALTNIPYSKVCLKGESSINQYRYLGCGRTTSFTAFFLWLNSLLRTSELRSWLSILRHAIIPCECHTWLDGIRMYRMISW